VELAGRLLCSGYRHSAALALNQQLFFWRLVFIGFAKAIATEQEDFGVFDQAVGDSSRDSGVVENVAPLGKRSVLCAQHFLCTVR